MKKWINYIERHVTKMGSQLVYAAMLLIYAYGQSDTPNWAKSTVIGVLGYILAPLDSVPDLTPFIGFTDDMGVALFGLVAIACYIDDEVRAKAKSKVLQYFPTTSDETFLLVDKRL